MEQGNLTQEEGKELNFILTQEKEIIETESSEIQSKIMEQLEKERKNKRKKGKYDIREIPWGEGEEGILREI